MNYPASVCMVGASGLVGHELLLLLGILDEISTVKAITRSPLGRLPVGIENILLDFNKLSSYSEVLKADIFVCCLGSTIKKAGSPEMFRQVDYDYVVEFAKIAEKVGAQKLLVISAMGADANSAIFYNRVKGEMENELRQLKIPQIEVFRPSLILGDRKEHRRGEEIAQKISPLLKPLLVGPLKKYRPITARDIAKAMAIAILNFHPGFHVYPSNKIQEIADQIQ
ncbi:MAG: nucleoside-diphosphate sugar epimerase [Bdellovibrio sp. ArHS]|uniref:nucleoside-diphosphate sugar epimerase n=1 Tax=Bdellovibrio sp. ArHS TaxID=1569284 RepID=UPI0005825248|nr:nucleoside-diphosphate sugar epimerase [Bdellovibrio sp. ArHS]KHD89385.1 MAG: nucleoside-diphosphate sugar epimerase [Bdellovibrio sp. ArHS]